VLEEVKTGISTCIIITPLLQPRVTIAQRTLIAIEETDNG
jgi:hypothetical protein